MSTYKIKHKSTLLPLTIPLLLTGILFALTGSPAYSQDSILFKMYFQPGLIYIQTMSQKFDLVMTYDTSNTALIKALHDQGMDNPMRKKMEMFARMKIVTGAVGSEQRFPLVEEVLANKEGEGESPIPPGTKIFGSATTETMPAMDSIAAPGMDSTKRNALFGILKSMFSQVVLPDKKMTIGQSYTMKTPLTIPVGGLTVNMNLAITYKLLSVTKTSADFDIDMKYAINMEAQNVPVTGSGTGTGTLVFDRVHGFVTTNNITQHIAVKGMSEGVSIEVVLGGNSVQTCSVTAAN